MAVAVRAGDKVQKELCRMKSGTEFARFPCRVDFYGQDRLPVAAANPHDHSLAKLQTHRVLRGDIQEIRGTNLCVVSAHGHRPGIELVEASAGCQEEGKFCRGRLAGWPIGNSPQFGPLPDGKSLGVKDL